MAGGLALANLTDPDRIWSEATVRLRAEIGDGPFSSYIAPSAVRADAAGQGSAPAVFLRVGMEVR